MRTFKATIAYDGTGFVGWQRQAAGTSIQGLLETALQALDEREVVATGAGRTDAGVHATGQVASFSLRREIEGAALVRAVNARLPPAVRMVAAVEAPAAFHARFDALRKTYRYRIWHAEVLCPFERAYAWHLAGPLDVEAMHAAAALIGGHRDFAAFQAAGSASTSSVREVYASRVFRAGGESGGDPCQLPPVIVYEVTGSGFLRHMVRNIVGSLVEVGRGRQSVGWIAEILERRERALAGPTAPPHGLVLASVEYAARLLAAGR